MKAGIHTNSMSVPLIRRTRLLNDFLLSEVEPGYVFQSKSDSRDKSLGQQRAAAMGSVTEEKLTVTRLRSSPDWLCASS